MPNNESSTVKTSTTSEPSPNESPAHGQTTTGQPMESEEMLEQLMRLLALELLTAKKNGKPLSENLPLIDRLLKHEALRQRRAALRLRERKAEAKNSATRPPAVPQPSATTKKSSPEELARINALLRQSGKLSPEQLSGKNSEFRIDPKIIALPLMGEAPMATKAR